VARFLNGPPSSTAVVAAQEVEFRLREGDRCRVDPEAPELYFSADLQGYGWCARKGDYLNVGLGRRDPERLSTHLRAFLEYLHEEARVPDDLPPPWRGHAYLLYEQTSRRVVEDGVLLVGDAAGLAYPESGEGILPAVESGLLAARAVLGAAGSYPRARLEPYVSTLEGLRGPRRPRAPLPRALATRISRPFLSSKWLARHVVLDRFFLHLRGPAASRPSLAPAA
jgi:flavin-dependent dehydrogenase